MTIRKRLSLVSILLGWVVITAQAQSAVTIIERIGRSLPEADAAWKLIAKDAHRRDDGTWQANLRWNRGTSEGHGTSESRGSSEKGATVFVHPSLKVAKRAFRPQGKEDVSEGFRIDGVGDEAFLWPPKAAQGGAYNIRFRRAEVEVWTSGGTEEEAKRHASILAASINASR
jgi:hypothetical protein